MSESTKLISMKRFLAPIVLFTVVFPSFAFGDDVEYSESMEREGLYYKKFTDVPFTGKTTGRKQYSFKDGKRDGPYVGYYGNGQLSEKGAFKNGEKDGHWKQYWFYGQLKVKKVYRDGKRHGLEFFYDTNGKLQ